jgi:peptidoglycan LD-endopeptidase LytH
LKKLQKISLLILVVVIIGLIIPQKVLMPVAGATASNYNAHSFWFYPWGKSVTHKGVDIFAKEGTNVVSSIDGFVIGAGQIEMGGNFVMVLGPQWRLYYYAHLKEIKTSRFSWADKGEVIGTVGTTGNAKGKAPHLHYTIKTLIPYFWRMDSSKQGWKKMFYLDPDEYLKDVK